MAAHQPNAAVHVVVSGGHSIAEQRGPPATGRNANLHFSEQRGPPATGRNANLHFCNRRETLENPLRKGGDAAVAQAPILSGSKKRGASSGEEAPNQLGTGRLSEAWCKAGEPSSAQVWHFIRKISLPQIHRR